MAGPHRAFARRNFPLGPKDVFAFCDGSICVNAAKNRAAAADFTVIYDNKAAQIRNAVVIVDDEWCARLDGKSANLVSLQLFALVAAYLQRGRIHYLLDRNDLTFYLLRSQTQFVEMSNSQRF